MNKLRFKKDQADIVVWFSQYHQASQFGITLTQLSRIGKTLSDD